MKILIIGYGVVGKNMNQVFPNADISDPEYPTISIDPDNVKEYNVAFVCVPTDSNEDGNADTKIVKHVIADFAGKVKVFCIRSTIPPGTTEEMQRMFDLPNIVFSPEYFGATIHANDPDYEFIILGGHKPYTSIVADAYIEVTHPNFKIIQTDSRSAELCKYMENSWLAMKVVFCNEFYRIAEKNKVDYNQLRELFLMDPRVDRSHTYVYKDKPYFDSHCLNKDIPAIIADSESKGYKPDLLKQVLKSNEIFKRG